MKFLLARDWMKSGALWVGVAAVPVLVGVIGWRVVPVSGASAKSAGWNEAAAAQYLDKRETWWQEWPKAKRDHDTICISCHTVLPYALARPGLRRTLHEAEMPGPEKVMLANLEKRVSNWTEMVPFYSDAVSGVGKTAESHATEAVLNAVILASYDARGGHLRPITRTAFDSAWALQEESGELAGGWKWQDFHLGPWEGSESGYQGAAMLMMELGNVPDGYAKEPAVRAHTERLIAYLRKNYAAQPVVNQLYVLWGSGKTPELLTASERKTLLEKVRTLQQADGGWRVAAMDKKERSDHSPEPMESDGYATGLVVLALEDSGVSRRDAMLKRGVEWLEQHQQKDGNWQAASLNKLRLADSAPAPFMSDAATGYAVLALERSR